jgi:hypothetical protein
MELIMGLIAGREQKKGEIERVKGEARVYDYGTVIVG